MNIKGCIEDQLNDSKGLFYQTLYFSYFASLWPQLWLLYVTAVFVIYYFHQIALSARQYTQCQLILISRKLLESIKSSLMLMVKNKCCLYIVIIVIIYCQAQI